MSDFQQLRSDFQRPGISLVRGPANLTSVLLEHEGASARVSTYGAHVIDYQPRDQAPVLWLSSHAVFQAPKAIRGGIPICWPWFAENGTDAALPAHGFARTSEWTLVDSLSSREEKSVTLLLCDDACTRAMWPHPFELRYRVTVTERLCASLSVTNTGRQRMRFTGALHSYFDVLDIAQVSVEGLQGSTYVDKLDANCHKLQGEPRLRISSEVDRTY
ncbi:MAG: glucose-6-phosphate 1-epimerase, partial [Gammaproteobacteria bacterium]